MNACSTHARTWPGQRGAATLLMVLGLVLLATLASSWSNRAVLMDLLSTQTRVQGLQARGAAQTALAIAQAQILQAFESPATSGTGPALASGPPCPAPWQDPRWHCATLPLGPLPEDGDWALHTLVVRDLLQSPHVWQLHAQARHSSGRGQASLRESIFLPTLAPAPDSTPQTALLLNGCYSEAAGSLWQLCPANASGSSCTGYSSGLAVYSHFVPDSNGDNTLSITERGACLAVPASSLPGGGTLLGPSAPVERNPCNRASWRSVFGDTTPVQLQAWSELQTQNGLNPLSKPARTVYWIDSPADWTQSLGQPEAPVLLVFSQLACTPRCPRIATGVQIHGTVFVDAGCDDERLRGWQAGTIDGLLAIEGGLPAVTGASLVRARAYARQAFTLRWPEGMDSRRAQRIAGSQRAGAP